MIGPGACNDRFGFIKSSELYAKIEDIDIVNTTPGSVYSTGILFPKRIPYINQELNDQNDQLEEDSKTKDSKYDEESDAEEMSNETDLDIDQNEKYQLLSASENDDLYSLNQHYPNVIGISCCVDSGIQIIDSNDIKLTISGRYYNKIAKSEINQIIVYVKEDYQDFVHFFEKFKDELAPYYILHSNGVSSKDDFYSNHQEAKKLLLRINLTLTEEIAKNSDSSIDEHYIIIGENYRYLKSYKEKLWAVLNKINNNGESYLSILEKESIKKRIKIIEKYETFLSYLEDVNSMNNSKSYGYWIGNTFSKEVNLSKIDFNFNSPKTIYSPNEYQDLKNIIQFELDDDIIASLSIWIQVTKSSRDENSTKKFLKIQLQNTSTPFKEDSKKYFSIVSEKVNQLCFFDVEIKIESKSLCPYQNKKKRNDINKDVDELNFLYRSIHDYGIGHFCSVDWNITENSKIVKSEFIPSFEIPDVEPIPRNKMEYVIEDKKLVPKRFMNETKVLEFKWLSTLSDATNEQIISKLYEFIETYKDWIDILKTKANSNKFAIQNISFCENDYNRIKSNIQLILQDNPSNIESFRLMNTVMYIQLWHSKNSPNEIISKDFYKRTSDHIFGDFPATWRPFQIAFILLNLDGIFQRSDDPFWVRRNELVDLVWFPTGGGKTEAYLGIIALSIINRRKTVVENYNNGGTTAIMRYTLRLLATQQFQRAMKVIFALEQVRRFNEIDLGSEPITIGLFVGNDSLPNTVKDTSTSKGLLSECNEWSQIIDGERKKSKIPLNKCPWCNELLEYVDKGTNTNPMIYFRCKNIKCTFSDTIPVILCDENIYENPPTLLFGTVDKFAAIGHKVSTKQNEINKDSRRIFGNGQLSNLPPDLIIQDELHLLLGPLGSAVSLFECAIDQLCTFSKMNNAGNEITIRPKIISSTATTRNTELQIRALYDRDVNIFPKNGIDYDDSFFAFFKREKKNDVIKYVSKRKYLGILPTGRTQMTTQMRLIATIFVHRAIFEKQNWTNLTDKEIEKSMDYYHSIISYFNSLKEVGNTDAQFYTEFTKYTRRLLKRVLRQSNMLECYYGYDSSYSKSELTGRLSGSEVVKQLSIVGQRWNTNQRLPYKNNKDDSIWNKGKTPPDLILATNMISVGLDIDRFNIMIINSMPRNIAEYIQASSRVARDEMGIVITLHNPFRSRDLSHFEKFREFHEKLYYYVEPISVTPFSIKSVEKYLPLYLTTIIRHTYPELADQASASDMNFTLAKKLKDELIEYFDHRLIRSENLDYSQKNLLTEDLIINIKDFIDKAIDQWKILASYQSTDNYILRYSGSEYLNRNCRSRMKYKDLFLALDAYEDENFQNFWTVPQSLRNVEPEAVVNINEKTHF